MTIEWLLITFLVGIIVGIIIGISKNHTEIHHYG